MSQNLTHKLPTKPGMYLYRETSSEGSKIMVKFVWLDNDDGELLYNGKKGDVFVVGAEKNALWSEKPI